MSNLKLATFGGGCFWCTEAVFQELAGVLKVTSGYTGGQTENPTYQDICNGNTGHAEVIQIEFDPEKISFSQLMEVFFATHDPTTPNQQGNDIGTQYRSVIYFHDENQKTQAVDFIQRLNDAQAFAGPVVTEVSSLETFHPAEDYHQDFFRSNPNQPYCTYVIPPKLEKLQKAFPGLVKE